MDYLPNLRFDKNDPPKVAHSDNPHLWRALHFQFQDLPDGTDEEKLARKIFKIFESLSGQFYYHPRAGIAVHCRMLDVIIIDDIIYKIKSLIKGDYMCRMGEQSTLPKGVVSLQFLFSPTSSEQQKLSQEFIMQEKLKRPNDVIMLVEDDLFARNIAKNA